MLPKDLFYYATTAVEMEPNHWHRVNRIAHVLFPHLYLLDQKKMVKYMESNHQIDEDIKSAIYDNVLNYTKIAGYQGDPAAYATALLKRIYPDVLTYTVGTDAEYTISRINGRPLQADAMNIALALLVGSENPIDDKVGIILERYQEAFPFVVPIDNEYLNAAEKVVKIEVPAGDMLQPAKTERKIDNSVWFIVASVVAVFIMLIFSRKKGTKS